MERTYDSEEELQMGFGKVVDIDIDSVTDKVDVEDILKECIRL